MNNEGGLGLTAAILLVGFLLISATVASVLIGRTETLSDRDLTQMAEKMFEDISTYLQIRDCVGKYYTIDGEQRIQKIAFLLKPLFASDIDAATLTIKLCNGEQVRMLQYTENAAFIDSQSLFEHELWDELPTTSYGFVVLLDKDRSLVNYGIINDNTDMAYIAIKLPEAFSLKKGDTLTITLLPAAGIPVSKTVVAPLPIPKIVSLE